MSDRTHLEARLADTAGLRAELAHQARPADASEAAPIVIVPRTIMAVGVGPVRRVPALVGMTASPLLMHGGIPLSAASTHVEADSSADSPNVKSSLTDSLNFRLAQG